MMRRFLAVLLMMFPGAAWAQFPGMEFVRPVSGAQFGNITSTSITLTSAMYYTLARFVCTVSCQVNLNVSGTTIAATQATSMLLMPNDPSIFIVPIGSRITVITASGAAATGGKIHVQEMSR